jgi:hypothetical protein
MLNKVMKNIGIVFVLLFCVNQAGKCQAVNNSANNKAVDTSGIHVTPNLPPPASSGVVVTPNIHRAEVTPNLPFPKAAVPQNAKQNTSEPAAKSDNTSANPEQK